jgi:peptide/nickel transport system substrate-binding protein
MKPGRRGRPGRRTCSGSAGTGGVLLLLGGVAACGGDERAEGPRLADLPPFCQQVLPAVDAFMAEHGSPDGDAAARRGRAGTVVVGGAAPPATGMHPITAVDHIGAQHLKHVLLMPLVRRSADLEPEPWLARSWAFEADGTELVFHLRDDVAWHDGTPTTAHDVAFTWSRVTDPSWGYPNPERWAHYVPGEDGVEVVDDHTVRFRLRPHAEPLDPWFELPIAPRHLLADVPSDAFPSHPYGSRCPVGNGPFRFVSAGVDGGWTFAANPAFPEELGGPPAVNRYVYRVVPERSTLLAELLTGGIDVYVQPHPDQFDRIQADAGVRLLTFPFRDYTMIAWNGRRPTLADPRVRQALTLALDRDEIVAAMLGGRGTVAHTGVPEGHWTRVAARARDDASLPPVEARLPHDPGRARALLDEAGWRVREDGGIRRNGEGSPLEITILVNQGNRERAEVAEIVQSRLRAVGVAVEVRVLETATLGARITNPEARDFDGVVLGFLADFRVDDAVLFHSRSADRPLGLAGLADPEIDRLLEAIPLAVDPDEGLALWRAYEIRIAELQPFTWLYFGERGAGIAERVQDVEMDARGEWAGIQRWRIVD